MSTKIFWRGLLCGSFPAALYLKYVYSTFAVQGIPLKICSKKTPYVFPAWEKQWIGRIILGSSKIASKFIREFSEMFNSRQLLLHNDHILREGTAHALVFQWNTLRGCLSDVLHRSCSMRFVLTGDGWILQRVGLSIGALSELAKISSDLLFYSWKLHTGI